MRRARLILICCWGVLALYTDTASAQHKKKNAPLPPAAEDAEDYGPKTPPLMQQTDAGIVEMGTLNGADYRIDIPTNWNHSLAVYYHGYSLKMSHFQPEYPMTDHARAPFTRGYAVIESGYSVAGWALEKAYPETERLRKYFVKKYGLPKETFVIGTSMGGALAMMTLEQNPKMYTAGLNFCGAVGPTYEAMEKRFAWRAAFDYYFPGLTPPLVPTPQDFTESDAFRNKLEAALKGNPVASLAMRSLMGLRTELEVARTIQYITFQMADFQKKAGGNPFDNRNYIYTGTSPVSKTDYQLNDGVKRYAADPKAQKWIVDYYTPTGRMTKPMLAVHTVYDPLINASSISLYSHMVDEAGFGHNYVQKYVHHEGHCTISADEAGRAFDELLAWVHEKRVPQAGLLK